MVGDSLVADVGGASALGMIAIWEPRAEVLQAVQAARRARHGELVGVEATAREQLLASAWKRDVGRDAGRRPRRAPDIIIEHLGELPALCQ